MVRFKLTQVYIPKKMYMLSCDKFILITSDAARLPDNTVSRTQVCGITSASRHDLVSVITRVAVVNE